MVLRWMVKLWDKICDSWQACQWYEMSYSFCFYRCTCQWIVWSLARVCGVSFYIRITTLATDDPSIDDKIYQSLSGVFPCFRLTNATNQIGCSGDLIASLYSVYTALLLFTTASSTQTRGVIHVVSKMEDIDWLIQHGDNGPYIVAMEDTMFNR